MQIYEKLKTIQSQITVPKTRYNKFGDFKYRSLEDIVEGIKPLLSQTGTALILSDEIFFSNGRHYIKATATLTDGKDSITVYGYAREPENKVKMDDSQVSGMASSYARKYALNGLFAIDDVVDADHYDNTQSSNRPQPTSNSKQKENSTSDINLPPKVDDPKSQQIIDILADYYKSQENDKFKFSYDKLLKAIWSKYGRYPLTEAGAKKVKSQITIADCWEEVK